MAIAIWFHTGVTSYPTETSELDHFKSKSQLGPEIEIVRTSIHVHSGNWIDVNSGTNNISFEKTWALEQYNIILGYTVYMYPRLYLVFELYSFNFLESFHGLSGSIEGTATVGTWPVPSDYSGRGSDRLQWTYESHLARGAATSHARGNWWSPTKKLETKTMGLE